jgi:hypothetical protein
MTADELVQALASLPGCREVLVFADGVTEYPLRIVGVDEDGGLMAVEVDALPGTDLLVPLEDADAAVSW